jgi:hypothetical protein
MESKRRDLVIDEMREMRHRISEEFGHDPAKLVDHYMQLQGKHRGRIVGATKPKGKGLPPPADSTSKTDPSSANQQRRYGDGRVRAIDLRISHPMVNDPIQAEKSAS